MWNVGDSVWYETIDDYTGKELCFACVVTGTFYEPGDPIQAVNLRNVLTGEIYGGRDSQDCRPRRQT